MSTFHLASVPSTAATSTPAHSSDNESDYDDSSLPFPQELPRSAFLQPGFNPSEYLSTLHNRHQTLEDLRDDLRKRSQQLNQELLDLVNGNYEEFLSLGQDLKGGEEKVEVVRVGVMGFRREVEGLLKVVKEKEEEMEQALTEKEGVMRESLVGRGLLEVHERLGELEEGMGIAEGLDDDDEDELVDVEGSAEMAGLRRLNGFAGQYVLVMRMVDRFGPEHPFLVAQRPRMEELEKVLLLDLAAALRNGKKEGQTDVVLGLLRIYRMLGAEADGVRVLKGG